MAKLSWPNGVEVLFPFYGNKLDELIKQVDAPLVSDVTTKGAPQDTNEATFRGELLKEMANAYGIKDADIQRHYAGKPQEKGVQNWEWVHSILKALDETPLRDTAIDEFTRDVYVYLTYKAVRTAIDNIVSEKLPQEPCVVVGHSLGSVVGYNVLSKASAAVTVRRYITVGSPLGIKAIKSKLDHPLATPPCVKGWFNALDERDVVALYPLDKDNFPIKPTIENKTNVKNHTKNRHGITGYLDNPAVARKIHEALTTSL